MQPLTFQKQPAILRQMNDVLSGIFDWVKSDWQSNKIRFSFEILAWAISIGCSIVMALTVPTPPLLVLYPIWIIGCSIYAVCAWSRKSFGMLANYLLLVTIDSVGLLRMLL
jgi:hypothetical protein